MPHQVFRCGIPDRQTLRLMTRLSGNALGCRRFGLDGQRQALLFASELDDEVRPANVLGQDVGDVLTH